jgi:hypothetical protein
MDFRRSSGADGRFMSSEGAVLSVSFFWEEARGGGELDEKNN